MPKTHLKLKMGMPLSGWRRKASGVSSTRTMRFMSLPSLDRSCMKAQHVGRKSSLFPQLPAFLHGQASFVPTIGGYVVHLQTAHPR